MMVALVVLLQQVLTEIVSEVTPDRMDVVSLVLGVVHFNKER